MSTYQVIARKYRPQTFQEVLGQEAIVTTLKNAIKHTMLAHAYLFCGSRGTGKTTLARIFAKTLNCQALTLEGEPCNGCSSCKEISMGTSLDVLEIDGASHRGIDDIRQINDTISYASSGGKYKVFIIDEVHMLTKEAFNALLKTLEEPPSKVIFLFATTEPHKVLSTILSRCQRFNLNRIPIDKIVSKLERITLELGLEVERQALHLIAKRADGGLRDAESLFDQMIAFHEGAMTEQTVAETLGLVSKDLFFLIDQSGKEGKLAVAFEVAYQLFSQGKDITYFIESLTEHFRTLLVVKLSGVHTTHLGLLESDKSRYEDSAKLYSQEQCLSMLEYLVEMQDKLRFHPSIRIALESVLLHIMRSHQRIPVEILVRRLAELENGIHKQELATIINLSQDAEERGKVILKPSGLNEEGMAKAPTVCVSNEFMAVAKKLESKPKEISEEMSIHKQPIHMTVDPSPTPAELGIKVKAKESETVKKEISPSVPAKSLQSVMKVTEVSKSEPEQILTVREYSKVEQSRYDTLMQFAAVELEGTIRKQ